MALNINVEKSPGQCARCGMTVMQIEGRMACPNCVSDNAPKTGRTIIVTEPNGVGGPAKVEYANETSLVAAPSQSPTPPAVSVSAPKAGTINVNVPIAVLAEFLLWARKLKLPKDWREAEKIRAITEFQVELNTKMEDLTK